jgi:hypothetical protein
MAYDSVSHEIILDDVEYLFGLLKNSRLRARMAKELQKVKCENEKTAKPCKRYSANFSPSAIYTMRGEEFYTNKTKNGTKRKKLRLRTGSFDA